MLLGVRHHALIGPGVVTMIVVQSIFVGGRDSVRFLPRRCEHLRVLRQAIVVIEYAGVVLRDRFTVISILKVFRHPTERIVHTMVERTNCVPCASGRHTRRMRASESNYHLRQLMTSHSQSDAG